jgi:hypothetical protein
MRIFVPRSIGRKTRKTWKKRKTAGRRYVVNKKRTKLTCQVFFLFFQVFLVFLPIGTVHHGCS